VRSSGRAFAPQPVESFEMRALLIRFVCEDSGQDVVEYALLCVFVSLAGMATWLAIQDVIAEGYVSWDTAEQDLWIPPEP
jgi:Flp pilus assembly pilin Flp